MGIAQLMLKALHERGITTAVQATTTNIELKTERCTGLFYNYSKKQWAIYRISIGNKYRRSFVGTFSSNEILQNIESIAL